MKIDICEAEIKRNLTLGIKVSFCSAQGGGGGVRNRREGEEFESQRETGERGGQERHRQDGGSWS